MTRTIGVVAGADGSAAPGEGLRFFLDVLREVGRPIRRLPSDNFDAPTLEDCTAVALLGPLRPMAVREAVALRKWTAAGGSLLIASSCDPAAPAVAPPNWLDRLKIAFFPTNARDNESTAALIPGLAFGKRRVDLERPLARLAEASAPVQIGRSGRSLATGLLSVTHSLPAGRPGEFAFARLRYGMGFVLAVAANGLFSDQCLTDAGAGNLAFLNWLLPLWLPGLVEEEVKDRKSKAQRHRLLHGYPMRLVMRTADDAGRGAAEALFVPKEGRQLLVGVLPHPFCNPAVKGCGFCTFPHESHAADKGAAVVAKVMDELEDLVRRTPAWRGRPVKALYFGGGTANLTPAEPFAALCRKLAGLFDLSGAEITLEGVPAYFVRRRPSLLDVLPASLAARHYRISMGIQTFDETRLRQMGRAGFGDPDLFRQVVRQGHAAGYTVSADLLFNLPGQTRDEMRRDVEQAVELGLDHLGLYHLVLFKGLGTEWSKDAGLLARLPPNDEAAENWLSLRDMLLAAGFRQTTLTNFERAEFRGGGRRFLYEESAFCPEGHDVLGFGPSGFSLVADAAFGRAVKTANPESSAAYAAAAGDGPRWEKVFHYQRRDLKILYLTRKIALLGVNRAAYRALFGSDCLDDFPLEFGALAADGLMGPTDGEVRLTPRGMFYADTAAGLLASRRVQELRLERAADELRKAGGGPRVTPPRLSNSAGLSRMG